MYRAVAWSFLALLSLVPGLARAQEKDDIKELRLRDWQPRSMLVTKVTEVPRPAFPVIDVHNHLGGGKATLTAERVRRYLEKVPASIEGNGGDDQLFKAASILVNGFALSHEQALPFLHEYNARAEPPWPEQRLVYKLTEALFKKRRSLLRSE